jgi:hypothetical protein
MIKLKIPHLALNNNHSLTHLRCYHTLQVKFDLEVCLNISTVINIKILTNSNQLIQSYKFTSFSLCGFDHRDAWNLHTNIIWSKRSTDFKELSLCSVWYHLKAGFTVYKTDKIDEKFEDTKGVTKDRASSKNRQYQKLKGQNNKRNITQKTKDWATRTPQKTYELVYSGWGGGYKGAFRIYILKYPSCFTSKQVYALMLD